MVTAAFAVSNDVDDVFNAANWETISFKVHTKTYCIPKFKFIHVQMCPGKQNPVLIALNQTSSAKCAIRVDEIITENDFEILLRLLYPIDHKHVHTPLSNMWFKDEWISVLKISSLWFYQDLRNMALKYLDDDPSLSNIDRITLGRAYSIPKWVNEGLCALGHSHTVLNADVLSSLGHLTALHVYQIRERKDFPEARRNVDSVTIAEEYVSVEEDVGHVFRAEFEELEVSFQEYGILELARPTTSPPKISLDQPTSIPAIEARSQPTRLTSSSLLPPWPQTASSPKLAPTSPTSIPPPILSSSTPPDLAAPPPPHIPPVLPTPSFSSQDEDEDVLINQPQENDSLVTNFSKTVSERRRTLNEEVGTSGSERIGPTYQTWRSGEVRSSRSSKSRAGDSTPNLSLSSRLAVADSNPSHLSTDVRMIQDVNAIFQSMWKSFSKSLA